MKMTLNISLPPEKIQAINLFLLFKNTTLQAELQKYTEQLYTKIVPQPVKDYIEAKADSSKADKKSADKPKP